MPRSLKEVMIEKSDAGLMDYLDNYQKYTSESIRAAADELIRRGRIFSDAEAKEVESKIESRKGADDDEDGLREYDLWRKKVVNDPNAPLFYSKGAIRLFSLFFSTIFGAVLLSFNLHDNKKKWIVIGFGIVYTGATITILNFMPLNSIYVIMINTAGGLALTSTFWNMYIGQQTVYREKPIWKALIISILISIPFVLAAIYG